MPPDLEGHWPQSPIQLGPHRTQNSELDPSLDAVLPVEGDTGVEAAIFRSHLADDQSAIRLLLESGDQTDSGAPSHWGGGWGGGASDHRAARPSTHSLQVPGL